MAEDNSRIDELAILNEVDEKILLVVYFGGELRASQKKETRLDKHTFRFKKCGGTIYFLLVLR